MTHTITFAGRAEVEAALGDPSLVPPPAPTSIGAGATAELRAAMARFSSGRDHLDRRADVVAAIDGLDPAQVRAVAATRTARLLTGARIDVIADVGDRVPVPTLADALAGVGAGDAEGLTDEVRAVVEVIGRGAPSSPASDAAATRLLHRFAAHPAGPVPVVSVLYQAHDATAALLATTIVSRHTSAPRGSAVARTLRTAVTDTVVAGRPIAAGTTVEVDLATTGLELGSGPHRCPGSEIAEVVVAGIVEALTERGYEMDDPGDPPTVLPMAARG